ncbi:MAG: PGPGW domain-containing protein [Planctomycetaceae bacterium]
MPDPKTFPDSAPSRWSDFCWTQARKIVVLVVGVTVLLLGVAMLVLPGPGWVTIFVGLAILATEFAWAKWMLKHAKNHAEKLVNSAKQQLGMTTTNGDDKNEPGDAAAGR